MKKYFAKGSGSKDFTGLSLNAETITIDTEKFINEYKAFSGGVLFLRLNGKNYVLNKLSGEENLYNISVNGKSYTIECKSELDVIKEKFSGSGAGRKKASNIISPMPGAVVKISVSEGHKVKKGDVLLVLEAMKMENEIKAQESCIVKKILVEEKQSVDKGQLLIELSFEI
jgi:biotin carboxyl carrier protein